MSASKRAPRAARASTGSARGAGLSRQGARAARALLALLLATPAFAVPSGHSGQVHPRTGPEPSDIALFAVAAIAIWLVRRRLRKRFDKD